MKKLYLLAALLSGTLAHGAGTLEFDDALLFGGTLTYGGADGVDPLVGTGIRYDQVTGVGTPVAGTLEIVGGSLAFTTGPNTSEAAALYQFAGGGSFTLSGTVIKPDLSVVASGILLSGHFTGTSIVIGLGGGQGLFSGVGVDEKNAALLSYFGLGLSEFEFADTQIGFAAAGLEADGGFVASVLDADLTNSPIVVPESGTWIAALGIGMALVLRKKLTH